MSSCVCRGTPYVQEGLLEDEENIIEDEEKSLRMKKNVVIVMECLKFLHMMTYNVG